MTFAFLDKLIIEEMKLKMIMAMLLKSEINVEDDDVETHLKKLLLRKENVSQFLICSDKRILIKLITQNSVNAFKVFNFSNYLNSRPSERINSKECNQGKHTEA